MKKTILSIIAGVACALSAYAVPACPEATKILQPDGSYVTVKLVGDEYLHFTTTVDGYTIARNESGYYVYVEKVDGVLLRTPIVAHDVDSRTADEVKFLQSVPKRLVADEDVTVSKTARIKAEESYKASPLAVAAKPKAYDYKNFRGLVILAEFSDKKFSRSDIKDVFTNMITQKDYKGVPSENDPARITECTGSVRDYFYDNSFGKFDPEFDVVGPVSVNRSCEYAGGSSFTNVPTLIKEVIKAADAIVNFKDYDRDGDGYVEMFYIVFAGYGSNYSGNNDNFVWPHASVNYTLVDGVYTSRYACSTELAGLEGTKVIDGIGTICHEFSHVLGLVDEYDVDYEGSGGQSFDPQTWSIMANGSYLNNSRTPCGYSLFQRYQSGFITPAVISEPGEYTLNSLAESGDGYLIKSAVDKEYFLFENRRLSDKWNKYMPGEGMLVFRVDSTSTSPWSRNTVNANPAHNYYEMLRAKPANDLSSASDPFPGTRNVTKLTNNTATNLKSWSGRPTKLVLSNIAEDADGVIHFTVGEDSFGEKAEDFESMEQFTGSKSGVQGKFAMWNFSNAAVVSSTSGDNTVGNGAQAVKFSKNGVITMTTDVWAENIDVFRFKTWNFSLSSATVYVSISTDGGKTWTDIYPEGTSVSAVVKYGYSGYEFRYKVGTSDHVMFKIESTKACYIDDITIEFEGKSGLSAVDNVAADVAAQGLAVVADGTSIRVFTESEEAVEVYTAGGVLVSRNNAVAGGCLIELPQRGFYIVRQGAKSAKIIL